MNKLYKLSQKFQKQAEDEYNPYAPPKEPHKPEKPTEIPEADYILEQIRTMCDMVEKRYKKGPVASEFFGKILFIKNLKLALFILRKAYDGVEDLDIFFRPTGKN